MCVALHCFNMHTNTSCHTQQLGDRLMIDSAINPLKPKVAFPSTVISVNPSKLWLWRNYNYPVGHAGRYSGSFRHTVRECLRATTAAPTFFSPLLINGTLYSGICNNAYTSYDVHIYTVL
jgi:hypothetical protein